MAPIFVYIVTHTTRHLDLVFAGLARQTRRPDRVVLSCDTDDPRLGAVAERWAGRVGAPIDWVRRAHHGIARCSQVRNNAVRRLVNDLGHSTGRVIQIDGDILCPDGFVERHAELGGERGLVYAYRVNLSESETAGLDAERVYLGGQRPEFTASDLATLRRRDRRYRRQLLMRRLGLGALHKPKLLGCNWSGPLEAWIDLNGFDEHFQGWGYLDDEFARRAAARGWPCVPACASVPCWHLFHPTRQPQGALTANPNHARFVRPDLPSVAERGLRGEIGQHGVATTRVGECRPAETHSHLA
ncbi:MAG TPA: hypothetical protein DEB06_07055 [Phycisphaerales bacterium]|nr:hypothetical protein [Phycisphaerales bacterium]